MIPHKTNVEMVTAATPVHNDPVMYLSSIKNTKSFIMATPLVEDFFSKKSRGEGGQMKKGPSV